MRKLLILAVALASLAVSAQCGYCGLVDIVLRPTTQAVHVGDEAAVGLYMVSESGGNQPFIITDVILVYNPGQIVYSRLSSDGAPYEWMYDGFFAGAINDNLNDGDMKYGAYSVLGGTPAAATPSGLLATTFVFNAVAPAVHARIDIPALTLSDTTDVFAADEPNTDIKGQLFGADILVAEAGTSPSVRQLKQSPDLAVREVRGPAVTRVFPTENAFYLEDTSRATGIRVQCRASQPLPTEGTVPSVFGVLRTVDQERVLDEAVVVTRSETGVITPMSASARDAAATVGLKMTGLLVRVAGRISVTSSTGFTMATGPGLPPLRFRLDGAFAPTDNSFCAVTGCVGSDASGQLVHVSRSEDIGVISAGH